MEWIPVSERLPESPSRVLVYVTDTALMCYGVALFYDGSFLFDSTFKGLDSFFKIEKADDMFINPSHWMPLPPPPINK